MLLLDTHAFIWCVASPGKLRTDAFERLRSPDQRVFVSAVSGYEIGFKANLGKLTWLGTVESAVQIAGFSLLPISLEHAERAARLPLHHRDTFDRLLIAQAQVENMALVTNDRAMDAYAVERMAC